jgi:hypothetical protein
MVYSDHVSRTGILFSNEYFFLGFRPWIIKGAYLITSKLTLWYRMSIFPFLIGMEDLKKKKNAVEDQEHMVIELRFRNYHADRCTIYLIICY